MRSIAVVLVVLPLAGCAAAGPAITEGDHGVYTTTVCRNDEGAWTWAAAEPSIHRWGYLQ